MEEVEFVPIERGISWSVGYRMTGGQYQYVLHNLLEWQARAICVILNAA